MEATPLKDEMVHYFSQLNIAEQQSILNMLRTFIESRDVDTQQPTTKDYTRELEEADAEIEAGDYVTHDVVKKRFIK